MKSNYYTELMEKPVEQHDLETLVTASHADMEDDDFNEDDSITLSQYHDLKDKWDSFQDKCKIELMRRIKDMLYKFAKYGEPGIKAMNVLNDLENVTVTSDKGIDDIFKGWNSYYFSTKDLFGRNFGYLSVNMREYNRGECYECDYRFPLKFFDNDFDPITNEKVRNKILECEYANAIPATPTVEQMKRFLDEYNNDENFRTKINAVFGREEQSCQMR